MGQFIFDIKEGDRPLTLRDLPEPGPADYSPDYTRKHCVDRAPAFSLAGWTKGCENKLKVSSEVHTRTVIY